jgi:hypothetical protein
MSEPMPWTVSINPELPLDDAQMEVDLDLNAVQVRFRLTYLTPHTR